MKELLLGQANYSYDGNPTGKEWSGDVFIQLHRKCEAIYTKDRGSGIGLFNARAITVSAKTEWNAFTLKNG